METPPTVPPAGQEAKSTDSSYTGPLKSQVNEMWNEMDKQKLSFDEFGAEISLVKPVNLNDSLNMSLARRQAISANHNCVLDDSKRVTSAANLSQVEPLMDSDRGITLADSKKMESSESKTLISAKGLVAENEMPSQTQFVNEEDQERVATPPAKPALEEAPNSVAAVASCQSGQSSDLVQLDDHDHNKLKPLSLKSYFKKKTDKI